LPSSDCGKAGAVMLEDHLRATPEATLTRGMQKAAGEKQKSGKQKGEGMRGKANAEILKS
jgi:hypothetical protein